MLFWLIKLVKYVFAFIQCRVLFSLTIHYFALAGCYFRAAFKSHSLFSKGFDSGTGWDDCSKNGTKSVSSNNFVAG